MSVHAQRVAVTGMGIVSPLGTGCARNFSSLVGGQRAFSDVTLFDVSAMRSRIAGQVDIRVSDAAPKGRANVWSRTDAMAAVAAREALEQAGLWQTPSPVAVAVGGTTGGMFEAESVLARLSTDRAMAPSMNQLLSYPLSTTALRLEEIFPHVHAALTVCSACSSGANAIVQAAAWITTGAAERVLCGGADGLCLLTFAGFNALQIVDTTPCRPFDRSRAGMSLGEGASFLLLESETSARRRGVQILAWLSGWAVGAEAHHITLPEQSGRTPAELLRRALHRAGLTAADIDYVNAHGTGTVPNDAMEARALSDALGSDARRIYVSSSKGQIGHTLGAAGAIEAAFTVSCLREGRMPLTAGLLQPDDHDTLRHIVHESIVAPVRAALSNSFGFGGAGTVLLFERADSPSKAQPVSKRRCVITATTTVAPAGMTTLAAARPGAQSSPARAAEAPQSLEPLDAKRSRRFDVASYWTTLGAEQLVRSAELDPAEVGLIGATAYGNLERSARFVRDAISTGRAAPAEFPHLVPSAICGNASIYLGLRGPVLTTCELRVSAESAIYAAATWLGSGDATAVVAGGAEPRDHLVGDVLGPLFEGEQASSRAEGAAFVLLETEQSAEQRGVRPLALVEHCVQLGAARLGAVELPRPPVDPSRAIVVLGVADDDMDVLLESAGWKSCRRVAVEAECGHHDALGGFALHAAVRAIAGGAATEVLVAASAFGRRYLTLIVAPP